MLSLQVSVCYQPYNLVFVACKVKQLPFLFVIAVAHIHNFAQAILRNLDLKEGLAGAEAYPSLIKSRNFRCLRRDINTLQLPSS